MQKVTLLQIFNPFKDPDIYTGIFSIPADESQDNPSLMAIISEYLKQFYKDCSGFGSYFDDLYEKFLKEPTIKNLNYILYGKDSSEKYDHSWYDITCIVISIRNFEIQD